MHAPGDEVYINGRGDLMFTKMACINKYAKIVKQTKSGMWQVEYKGNLYSVPQRNLGEP
jgi:hypothetical protein